MPYKDYPELYLSDFGEAKLIEIQHDVTISKIGIYAGGVKGTVSRLSPELFFKYDKGLGPEYPIDLFKNDVYGNGILIIEQLHIHLANFNIINYIIVYIII